MNTRKDGLERPSYAPKNGRAENLFSSPLLTPLMLRPKMNSHPNLKGKSMMKRRRVSPQLTRGQFSLFQLCLLMFAAVIAVNIYVKYDILFGGPKVKFSWTQPVAPDLFEEELEPRDTGPTDEEVLESLEQFWELQPMANPNAP
jgi:hypothetical protein